VRNFYRERLCMHALTIQGVEAVAVAPDSPAARAGFRPARGLSAREVATATVAGLLTLSPASSVAPSVVRAAGGVNHGDIILAVNGKRVKIQEEFQREILRYGSQATVYFTVRRGEEVLQIPARLDDWPASTAVAYFQ
jgi:S1-C subfamily serine protease